MYKKQRKETKEIIKLLRDELGEFVRREVGREPMVIPMYVFITKNEPKILTEKDEKEDIAGMTIEEQGGE